MIKYRKMKLICHAAHRLDFYEQVWSLLLMVFPSSAPTAFEGIETVVSTF